MEPRPIRWLISTQGSHREHRRQLRDRLRHDAQLRRRGRGQRPRDGRERGGGRREGSKYGGLHFACAEMTSPAVRGNACFVPLRPPTRQRLALQVETAHFWESLLPLRREFLQHPSAVVQSTPETIDFANALVSAAWLVLWQIHASLSKVGRPRRASPRRFHEYRSSGSQPRPANASFLEPELAYWRTSMLPAWAAPLAHCVRSARNH